MRAAPQSVNLCGRSAAERKLDRVYNAQKKVIKEKKGLSATNSVEKLPFPDIYKKNESKLPKSNTSVKDAIEILVKHLKNEKKFEKSITLLANLIESHFNDHKLEFMNALDVCIDQVNKLDNIIYCTFSNSPIIIALKSIFNSIKSQFINFGGDFDSEDELQIKLRRFMLHLGHSVSLINENDSFIFNDHVKLMDNAFNHYILKNSTDDDKRAFVRSLGTLFKFSALPWASSIVCNFFNKIYLQRNVFGPGEVSKIEEWQAALKSGKKASKESVVNEIGISAKGVKDGRVEVIVTTHGSQIWSNKQFGI